MLGEPDELGSNRRDHGAGDPQANPAASPFFSPAPIIPTIKEMSRYTPARWKKAQLPSTWKRIGRRNGRWHLQLKRDQLSNF